MKHLVYQRYFMRVFTALVIFTMIFLHAKPQCGTTALTYVQSQNDSTFTPLTLVKTDSIPCLPKIFPIDNYCVYFDVPSGSAAVNFIGLPLGAKYSVQLFEGLTCDKLCFYGVDTLDSNGGYLTSTFNNNSIRVCADFGTTISARVIPVAFPLPLLPPYLDLDTLCPMMSIADPIHRDPRPTTPGPWVDMQGRSYMVNPPADVLLYDLGRQRKVIIQRQ